MTCGMELRPGDRALFGGKKCGKEIEEDKE